MFKWTRVIDLELEKQIYEPKLEVESSNAFSKCSKDIFELIGPCTDQICFFYLYKNGSDNWIPETVEISSPDIDTVKYKYNSSIPNDTWYGFDDCQYFPSPSPPPPPPVPSAAGFLPRWKWLASLIPVLLSSAVLWMWCSFCILAVGLVGFYFWSTALFVFSLCFLIFWWSYERL